MLKSFEDVWTRDTGIRSLGQPGTKGYTPTSLVGGRRHPPNSSGRGSSHFASARHARLALDSAHLSSPILSPSPILTRSDGDSGAPLRATRLVLGSAHLFNCGDAGRATEPCARSSLLIRPFAGENSHQVFSPSRPFSSLHAVRNRAPKLPI
jgi:hypothetical protein